MKIKRHLIVIIILIIVLLAWSPWITEEYAINKVTEKLGGPDAYFGGYLNVTVGNIPWNVAWFPFARGVYYPAEAVWFVTFYGQVK